MRNLLLAVVLVSWACAEPRQYTQPHPTADATGEEAAALVQAPGDREREEEQEEEQEEQEESEEPEQPTPAPVKPFSYDEWTAEPPTHGEPKIPGPPYPHLEAGGKKELYDRIRRLRWYLWPEDRVVLLEEAWLKNWEEWEEDGHLATAAAQPDAARLCRNDLPPSRLRANDPALRKILDKLIIAYPLTSERIDLPPGEFDYLLKEVSIYDTGAAIYIRGVQTLWDSVRTKDRKNIQIYYALRRKIGLAHRCSVATHNVCWSVWPSVTLRNLLEARCADQR